MDRRKFFKTAVAPKWGEMSSRTRNYAREESLRQDETPIKFRRYTELSEALIEGKTPRGTKLERTEDNF